MIVRIATEGQYRLPDEQAGRLNELDDAVVHAVESGEPERFEQRLEALLDFVRHGEPIDDAHLEGSDLILPPPDLTLEEAAGELSAEGLIPD